MGLMKHIVPFRRIGSSEAQVFGVSVFGHDHEETISKYFLRPLYSAGRKLKDIELWWFYNFTKRGRSCWTIKMDTATWWDEDQLLLHACFEILNKYIDNCTGYRTKTSGKFGDMQEFEKFSEELLVEPDKNAPKGLQRSQGESQKSHLELWKWWNFERPARHAAHDREMMNIWGNRAPKSEITKARLKAHWKEEADMRRADTDALKRLIDLRGSMWT